MTHTPGPWEVCNLTDVFENYTSGRQICDCDVAGQPDKPGLQECKANARLIAAAPDLLEACRELLQIARGIPYGQTLLPSDQEQIDRAIASGKAAIAKAKGE